MTTRREVAVTKKDMTRANAPEYLIASASCYPAFQKKDINGESYIDGGYTDNLPINLAISMGATSVIAVNLNSIGRMKKVKNTDIPITYIEPRNNLSSFLVFDPDLSKVSMKYGYNDAMKVFHRLDGYYFTFKKNQLDKNYEMYGSRFLENLKTLLDYGDANKTIFDDLLKLSIFHKLLCNGNSKQVEKVMNQTLENLGKLFKLDDTKIYSCRQFHMELLHQLQSMEVLNIKSIERRLKGKDLKSFINTATIVRYIYQRIQCSDSCRKKSDLCRLALVFPKEFIAAVYLDMLDVKE